MGSCPAYDVAESLYSAEAIMYFAAHGDQEQA